MPGIRIDTDNLLAPSPSRDAVWPVLERFLADMDAGRSGFFHLPDARQQSGPSGWSAQLARVQPKLAERIPHVDTFLHLGIGGSSLGAELLVRALASPKAPVFHFLDNIDPDHLWGVLEQVSPERALVYVVTKSGDTPETMAQLMVVYGWLEKSLGREAARKRLVFCTDPERGSLRKLSREWGVPAFEIPPNLGGRYSALCPVGLFPAMVAGVDAGAALKGAAECRARFLGEVAAGRVPAEADLALRLVRHGTENKRNVTVLMPYSQRLKLLSAWFTQLWAESLGKGGKGLTPVAACGVTDQHSILQLLRDGPADKVVGFVEVAGFQRVLDLRWDGPRLDSTEMLSGATLNQLLDSELNATREVLANNRRPSFSLVLPRLDAALLGHLIQFLEGVTALSGYFLEIDPFDQPGVEEGKKLARERIAKVAGLAKKAP